MPKDDVQDLKDQVAALTALVQATLARQQGGLPELPVTPLEDGHCGSCGREMAVADHKLGHCSACGTPFPPDFKDFGEKALATKHRIRDEEERRQQERAIRGEVPIGPEAAS